MVFIDRTLLGNMYGFEKLWAFLKYRKSTDKLEIDPTLESELKKFKSADDFHAIAAAAAESS